LGAPRFGGKPGKQGALDPRHRTGPAATHFADAAAADIPGHANHGLALVLGAGAAASVAARTKDRPASAGNGRVVMLSGSGAGVTDTGDGNNRLCIDAMLAARLAGYERPKTIIETMAETLAAARPAQAWRLPDDWKLAAAPSREAQALADVIGDNDDWVVHDGNGHLLEAAE
jgi:hypothetical protein